MKTTRCPSVLIMSSAPLDALRASSGRLNATRSAAPAALWPERRGGTSIEHPPLAQEMVDRFLHRGVAAGDALEEAGDARIALAARVDELERADAQPQVPLDGRQL